MAKFKLPESLKAWKVASSLPERNGYPVYSVTRKETDGSVTQGVMTSVAFQDEQYNSENIQIINEEAAFIKNVISCNGVSSYIDAAVLDRPSKKKAALFIIRQNLPDLASALKEKDMTEDEVLDFGLQMSDILQKLESRNIFHGNLKPENIYITPNGRYLLGGFTDFESVIDDLSCISPEIKENKQPDFTTDIYSVGLMMYAMCNNKAIPFEGEGTERSKAIEKRFEGQAVTAPANGNEKLKSVIVIACQPENKNRWKNAGNLKNALSAIKAEAAPKEEPKEEIIAPASTEFDGNVFEEYVYDDFEETEAAPEQEKSDGGNAAKAVAAGAAAVGAAVAGIAAANAAEGANNPSDEIKDTIHNNETEATVEAPVQSAPSDTDSEKTVSLNETPSAPSGSASTSAEGGDTNADKPYQEPEIDNRVFDDYQLHTKVFSINDANKNTDKDYGDYFDDEPEPEPEAETGNTDENVDTEFGKNGFYEDDSFYADQNKEEVRNRKGLIAVIIAAVALVALLATMGIVGAANGWFGGKQEETQPSTVNFTEEPVTDKPTTAPTTAPATTVPATTAPPTTLSEYDYPSDVVGAYYEYAKSILEDEGFVVVEGEYALSEYYEEGIVTSMSPDPSQELKRGSTITLNISSGLTESSDSDNSDDDQSDDNNDDDNYDYDYDEGGNDNSAPEANDTSYSQYKSNTSYLSKSDVNSMNRSELNLALNEIYARRGRIFEDPSLSNYFSSQSWYTPKYTASQFAQKVTLNDYENKNIQLIYDVQKSKGYR